MPITKREFQLGVDSKTRDIMGEIYDFLDSNRSLAFTDAELMDRAVPAHITSISYPELHRALDVLLKIGAVERRIIGEEQYYAFFREMNKNTWETKSAL